MLLQMLLVLLLLLLLLLLLDKVMSLLSFAPVEEVVMWVLQVVVMTVDLRRGYLEVALKIEDF